MKTVLSIGGSDSCGGAGIQGDIKTAIANGAYALTVVTALTAQNTKGVKAVTEVTVDFVKEQLDAVFEDFIPDAVKVGMLHSAKMISLVAGELKKHNAKNIVVDPVMLSGRNVQLLDDDAVAVLEEELFPIADVITPNINEISALTGIEIVKESNLIDAAKMLGDKYGCIVVSKGERMISDAADLYYRDGYYKWMRGQVILNKNHHGSGAALSCALAVNLAKGYEPDKAFKRAKDYVTGALNDDFNIGEGIGPINHGFAMNNEYTRVLSDMEISRI